MAEQNITIDKDKDSVEKSNLELVKMIVQRSENPHPLIIVLIIVITIIIVYIIYVFTIKVSLSGIWLDITDINKNSNIKHNIYHNTFMNTIRVDDKYDGIVNGRVVSINMGDKTKMGILVNNNISWLDNTTWGCSYGC
jgi:hypothetical protein